MNKTICVINGKGGIGKDTLINAVQQEEHTVVYNISSIDPIRELCSELTKGCKKDNAQRKLLSGMKELVDEYYEKEHGISYTQNYLQEGLRFALANANNYDHENAVIFIHIREPENIKAFLKMAEKQLSDTKDNDTILTTLLVESERAQESYGNSSDENVADYDYDYVFASNSDIKTDTKAFVKFFIKDVMTGKNKTERHELSQEFFESIKPGYIVDYEAFADRIEFDVDTEFAYDKELLRIYNERTHSNVQMPKTDDAWINTTYQLKVTEDGYKGFLVMYDGGEDYFDFHVDGCIELTHDETQSFIAVLERSFSKGIDDIFNDIENHGRVITGSLLSMSEIAFDEQYHYYNIQTTPEILQTITKACSHKSEEIYTVIVAIDPNYTDVELYVTDKYSGIINIDTSPEQENLKNEILSQINSNNTTLKDAFYKIDFQDSKNKYLSLGDVSVLNAAAQNLVDRGESRAKAKEILEGLCAFETVSGCTFIHKEKLHPFFKVSEKERDYLEK